MRIRALTSSLLLALALISEPAGAQQPAERPEWVVTRSRSEMTDDPTILLQLQSLTANATLHVRCQERMLEVYVATRSILARDTDGSRRTPVRIRFGSSSVAPDRWALSKDNTSAFSTEPRRFIEQLVQTPDLRFEFRPVGRAARVARFDASGLAAFVPVLGEACRETDTAYVMIDPNFKPNADQVFLESVVEVRPELLSAPPIQYPELLRQAAVQGRVLVQAILDTIGRVEPPSLRILATPNPGFEPPVKDFMLAARFRPARVHGRAVRVLINLPLDFKIRRDSVPKPEREPEP